MKTVLIKIDKKIRTMTGPGISSYEEIWGDVWYEIARFLSEKLPAESVDELLVIMESQADEEEKLEKLAGLVSRLEMGKMRLLEKIIYFLDNYERTTK
ncbi:hypothetical protein A2397_05845 [Candidatus Amesbacteria bacterium RIFOXYB1_FULL_44_23]|uniref:Uncharacterized protein n=1 Tax=Candidatus Amesbacteria bacterium RIFOXYB1_FULL_44_23 TaxID=1797263 RepID=A0A1F4ZS91_9BACT|nr:MAG: hypothetical protein A2397_05845 [Candidatus Amesbacteria bacterium RIFOXYB1_FULL_44_23]